MSGKYVRARQNDNSLVFYIVFAFGLAFIYTDSVITNYDEGTGT